MLHRKLCETLIEHLQTSIVDSKLERGLDFQGSRRRVYMIVSGLPVRSTLLEGGFNYHDLDGSGSKRRRNFILKEGFFLPLFQGKQTDGLYQLLLELLHLLERMHQKSHRQVAGFVKSDAIIAYC